MDLKKIHTKKELDNALVNDKAKMDFAINQVTSLMDLFGIAGIEQESNGYKIKIEIIIKEQ